MCKLSSAILLLAATSLFAQLPSNTVTITATRSMNLQPDQVVFGLTVSSPNSATLDQIVTALAGLGITAADLSGVDNSDPAVLRWNFTLTAPFSHQTATIGSLTKLEQTIGQNDSRLTLTYSVNGTQVSQQLRQSGNCSDADLISDATVQAQKLVAAAGKTLGAIVTLSSVPLSEPVPGFAERLGGFVVPTRVGFAGSFGFSGFSLPAPSPAICSLRVQFRLLP